jgi:hypothetical protein
MPSRLRKARSLLWSQELGAGLSLMWHQPGVPGVGDQGRGALADALIPGERRAGPDDDSDPDPGELLGPVQAVGVPLGRALARQPEPHEHHGAGGDIGQILAISVKRA